MKQRVSLEGLLCKDKSLADKLQTGDAEKDKALKKLLLRLLDDVGTNICDYVIEEASLNIAELKANGAPEIVIKAMLEQFNKRGEKWIRF